MPTETDRRFEKDDNGEMKVRIELNTRKESLTKCKCENCDVKKSINKIKDFIVASLIACAVVFDLDPTLFIVLMAFAIIYDLL